MNITSLFELSPTHTTQIFLIQNHSVVVGCRADSIFDTGAKIICYTMPHDQKAMDLNNNIEVGFVNDINNWVVTGDEITEPGLQISPPLKAGFLLKFELVNAGNSNVKIWIK